jgi:Holliday junction resolvase RusA-like endonuclease
MAWTNETLRRIEREKPPIDERFADLLRKVASGQMSQDDAWSTWLQVKVQNETDEKTEIVITEI